MNDDPQTPSGTPSTEAPTGTATTPTEWRVPMDDARVWARGKTALELLSIGDQSINALYQVATMPTQQQQYQQPQAHRGGEIDDDAIVDGRMLKGFAQQYQQPQSDPAMVNQMAQLALANVKSEEPDVFASYGGEVYGEIAKLPAHLRTVDNIKTIVKLVKGNHVNELAEQLAKTRFANQNGLSVRTNGTAGYPGTTTSGPSLESEELPADYRDRLKRAGVTESMARSFCVASGMKFEDWIKNAKNLTTLIGEE